MMGVTGAQGLIAIVDARICDERPRPEIQPVGKCQGRQRQVRAVQQHGETLTSAAERAGSRGEAKALMSGMLGLLHHGDRDGFSVPRPGIESRGRSGSRNLDATGQHTRSFVQKLDSLRLPTITTAPGDRYAIEPPPPVVRSIDILSRARVRAKSEKTGISSRDDQAASCDGDEFPLMDNFKPLL
jgi:hypothetical protein